MVLQPSARPGCFWLCLGWQGHKIHCPREAKSHFCVNFGHLPPQYPGFGTKLSLKGKPGTCALLETFQSPIDLFSARKAFWTPAGVLYSAYIFLYLMMVCLHYVKAEMCSFPKSVAKHFCDQPLPQYLDPKTVLIYCPHPVLSKSGHLVRIRIWLEGDLIRIRLSVRISRYCSYPSRETRRSVRYSQMPKYNF